MAKKLKSAEDYMYHLFIHMNDVDHFVLFNGLSTKQLLESIDQPSNLLLLKHNFDEGSFNIHTQFDFVEVPELPSFVKRNEEKGSDVCFIDFSDERYVSQLTPFEQAELLYFAHKREPLGNPFSAKLQNRFLYYYSFSQNETKVYFRFLADCEIIVANLLNKMIREKEVGGSFWRKRSKEKSPKIDPLALKALRPLVKEGALVSLYKLGKPSSTYGIEIRILSDVTFPEEVWSELEEILKQGYDEHILIS
jgi:hypothetical protein